MILFAARFLSLALLSLVFNIELSLALFMRLVVVKKLLFPGCCKPPKSLSFSVA